MKATKVRKKKKKGDISGDEQPTEAKRHTPDVADIKTAMATDDEGITSEDSERLRSSSDPQHYFKKIDDAIKTMMNNPINTNIQDNHPYETPPAIMTFRTHNVEAIPPGVEEGPPNRIAARLMFHRAWVPNALKKIQKYYQAYCNVFRHQEQSVPLQSFSSKMEKDGSCWVMADHEETADYETSAFVYFVDRVVPHRYAHEMEKAGYRRSEDPKDEGPWIEVQPTQHQDTTAAEDQDKANAPADKTHSDDTSPPIANSDTTEETNTHPNELNQSTAPPGSRAHCTNQLRNCEEMVARNEKEIQQRTQSWGDREEANLQEADASKRAEEDPIDTPNTCLCDIGRINQPISYERLLTDLAAQFPGEFRCFSGYEHRNRKRTLGLNFNSSRAAESVAIKGLNTHNLHLQFRMEVPGLVMVSLDNIPTDVPMGDVVQVISRYGQIHSEPYISKRTIAGRSITIGTRVVGIIMDTANPVPPFLKIRGFEATAKYTGMEDYHFPTTHHTATQEQSRRSRTRSTSRNRRHSTNVVQALQQAVTRMGAGEASQPSNTTPPTPADGFTRVEENRKCFNCGKRGHVQADCSLPKRSQGIRGGPSAARNAHLFGRRDYNRTNQHQEYQQKLYEEHCKNRTCTRKDGTTVMSFLHPEYKDTGNESDHVRVFKRIYKSFRESQEADNTFDTGKHTDMPSSSPRQGPPGTVIKGGKRVQVMSYPIDIYMAFGLLETRTDFHVPLSKEDWNLTRALSGYLQFGPLKDVDVNSLDPTVYSVAVQELWGKLNLTDCVDVEGELAKIATTAFEGYYVDLTYDEDAGPLL